MIDVAMKMLQPVQPGPNARQSAVIAYKAAQGKWDRDPIQYACKAYCTARQELNILLSLRHPNIVPFIGVCTNPLALVLDLAPQGALDLVLRHYRRSGAKVGPYTLQAIILQVRKHYFIDIFVSFDLSHVILSENIYLSLPQNVFILNVHLISHI